jgi:hypothetical protein
VGFVTLLESGPRPKIYWVGSKCCFLFVSGPFSGRRSDLEVREGSSNFPVIVRKHAAIEVEIRFESTPEGFSLV